MENGYRDQPFPFERITPPRFVLQQAWSRDQLLGYLRSWSAVARFKAAQGYDPVDALADEIAGQWPDYEVMQVEWPLFMLAGRMG